MLVGSSEAQVHPPLQSLLKTVPHCFLAVATALRVPSMAAVVLSSQLDSQLFEGTIPSCFRHSMYALQEEYTSPSAITQKYVEAYLEECFSHLELPREL